MKPSPTGPFPYSPIVSRPRLGWPGDAKVAVWVIPNIEFFALDEQVVTSPGKVPNVPTYCARDYGVRVGVWRVMDVLDRHQVRATVALNSKVCDYYPQDNRRRYAARLGVDGPQPDEYTPPQHRPT
jgi:allantoinase